MTDDERPEGESPDDEPRGEEPREEEPRTEGGSPGEDAPDEGPPDDGDPDAEAPADAADADDTADDADDEPSPGADDVPEEGDGTPDEERPDDLSVEPSETLDDGTEGPRTLGERLHEFAVDLLESGTTSGSRRGGRISYGYTARTGPGGPASPHRRRRPGRSGEPSGDHAPDAHASVARDGDDVRVIVDLPGVDPDDLTVGIDPARDALVVAVEGQVVSRVPLEGADDVVDCWLNNHVLTVHLRDQ